MSDDDLAELEAAIGNLTFTFWACQIDGHSEGDWAPARLVQTVEWRKDIAYCLVPGCSQTSADDADRRADLRMVTDNGRRWWLLGGVLWTGLNLYAAPTERQAIAKHRRDLMAAERAGGRSIRDVTYWIQAARIRAVAGPLTTVAAYEYDLVCGYATALDKWTTETTLVPVNGNYPYDGIALAARIDPHLAAVIRRNTRNHFLAGTAEG